MVGTLASTLCSPGLVLGGQCVVFLGDTHYSRNACLHSGVYRGTSKFNTGSSIPFRGSTVEIVLVTSCY